MSAPHLELKETEYLSLGFMANSAETTLKTLLAGKQPSDEEIKSLKKATSFLNDIASGADFITTGQLSANFNPSRSLEALNFAMGPIDALKKVMKDDDVATFFRGIAQAVNNIYDRKSIESDRIHIEEAEEFFSIFYQWVIAELNARQPSLGPPKPRSGNFYLS
ncbi:MAG: hypothetical protein KME41_04505 [Candidatus Thiodiazotropha sp. (ex Lucina pensylvanica)]|nr:hypothetical protein [Candidatus Thiodiazotropha sp. (ex Lucina pensylvanica)]